MISLLIKGFTLFEPLYLHAAPALEKVLRTKFFYEYCYRMCGISVRAGNQPILAL